MLIEEMDASGVDKAVILGIYPRVKNEFIAEQVRAYPDRFIGFASVDPNDGVEAIELLEKCIRDYGLKGLKIHPSMQHFRADDVELLTPLMLKVEALSIPVLLHSWAWFDGQDNNSSPSRVMNLARKFPNITFIMAHTGGMRFMDLLVISRRKRIGQLDNLYVDISSILFDVANGPMAPIFRWTLEQIGLDRVLMGSDFPDYSLVEMVKLVRDLGFDENGLKLVMGENAQRLFGFFNAEAQRTQRNAEIGT